MTGVETYGKIIYFVSSIQLIYDFLLHQVSSKSQAFQPFLFILINKISSTSLYLSIKRMHFRLCLRGMGLVISWNRVMEEQEHKRTWQKRVHRSWNQQRMLYLRNSIYLRYLLLCSFFAHVNAVAVRQVHNPVEITKSLNSYKKFTGATQWRSWLSHCASSRRLAGSILNGVIGIYHWHNLSDHTLVLQSTQTPREMSTKSISWGVKAAGC
jgi:hypothetical protein